MYHEGDGGMMSFTSALLCTSTMGNKQFEAVAKYYDNGL